MLLRRLVVLGVLLVVIAGCGDDGPSLEDWAGQADDICNDVNDGLEELDLSDAGEVAESGEEAVDIINDGLEDLEALELPAGDDAEKAQALIDSLEDLANVREDLVELAQESSDDEVALYQIIADSAEQVDEGVEAAEEVDSDECGDIFSERQEGIEELQSSLEGLGTLAEVRVGDCLTGIDDIDTVAPADCDSDDAEGSVESIAIEGGGACSGADPVAITFSGFQYCISSFGPGAEEDELLQFGSCVLLEGERGEGSVDVTEFPCSDEAVTHIIDQEVGPDDTCDDDLDRRFDKSDEEIADSGPGEWCATPL